MGKASYSNKDLGTLSGLGLKYYMTDADPML